METAFTSFDNPVSAFVDDERDQDVAGGGGSGGGGVGEVRDVASGRAESVGAPSLSTSSSSQGPRGGVVEAGTVAGRGGGDTGRAGDDATLRARGSGFGSSFGRSGTGMPTPADAGATTADDEEHGPQGEACRDGDGEAEADDELGLESSVYVFGQIVGGRGFGNASINCSWEVFCHDSWRACMGETRGVTFTSQSRGDDEDALCVWSHPLDFQLATKSTRRWPQMTFRVRKIDAASGADTFAAYGMCALPMTSGPHSLTVPCWLANDRSTLLSDEMLRYHTSLTPELSNEAYIVDRGVFPSSALNTVGCGSVVVNFHVILKEIRFAAGMAIMQISDAMVDTRVKEWLVTAKKKREDRDKARRERMVSRMNKDAERGKAQNLASYAMATAKERHAPGPPTLSAGAAQTTSSRSSAQGEAGRSPRRAAARSVIVALDEDCPIGGGGDEWVTADR